MRFRIRFADQIVGAFFVTALLSLVFIIFMLGNSQRWFARDHSYTSYFDSAVGLSPNMAVQYKGITIGNVKSFRLTDDDRVEVVFVIYDVYTGRVKRGSLVDINISPIGLGNQFRFYAGLGEALAPGDLVPHVDSPEGKEFIQSGLAYFPIHDDNISLLLSQINNLVGDIDAALKGTDATSLGRTVIGVEETVTEVKALPKTIKQTVDTVDTLTGDIKSILTDINRITEKLNEPEGMVSMVLDGEGPVYTGLSSSLGSLSGILQNLDKTTGYLPADMPQVAALLGEVRAAVKTAEDVLTALTNNPLLKKGIPPKVQTQSGGTGSRDISF